MADIKPIRSERDHEAALTRISELMDAEPDSPEGDELDVLVDLVELYESKHVPMGLPSPIGAQARFVTNGRTTACYRSLSEAAKFAGNSAWGSASKIDPPLDGRFNTSRCMDRQGERRCRWWRHLRP